MVNPNMIKLTQPKATNKVVVTKNVTVSIDSLGNYSINKVKTSLDDLPSAISAGLTKLKSETKQDPVLIVNADRSVKWDNVVKIIVIGKKLNAKVMAATQKE